jgi:hypothetical protein
VGFSFLITTVVKNKNTRQTRSCKCNSSPFIISLDSISNFEDMDSKYALIVSSLEFSEGRLAFCSVSDYQREDPGNS